MVVELVINSFLFNLMAVKKFGLTQLLLFFAGLKNEAIFLCRYQIRWYCSSFLNGKTASDGWTVYKFFWFQSISSQEKNDRTQFLLFFTNRKRCFITVIVSVSIVIPFGLTNHRRCLNWLQRLFVRLQLVPLIKYRHIIICSPSSPKTGSRNYSFSFFTGDRNEAILHHAFWIRWYSSSIWMSKPHVMVGLTRCLFLIWLDCTC